MKRASATVATHRGAKSSKRIHPFGHYNTHSFRYLDDPELQLRVSYNAIFNGRDAIITAELPGDDDHWLYIGDDSGTGGGPDSGWHRPIPPVGYLAISDVTCPKYGYPTGKTYFVLDDPAVSIQVTSGVVNPMNTEGGNSGTLLWQAAQNQLPNGTRSDTYYCVGMYLDRYERQIFPYTNLGAIHINYLVSYSGKDSISDYISVWKNANQTFYIVQLFSDISTINIGFTTNSFISSSGQLYRPISDADRLACCSFGASTTLMCGGPNPTKQHVFKQHV